MSDLNVDAARLSEVSAVITSRAARVRPDPSMTERADGVLGSREVAAALRDGSAQQATRARVTADSLVRAGAAPASAARTFLAADAGLARAF
ncbi:hypothetical protein [Leifsonia poae]|uniref:Uncharacterized protein n=1 Tax=Leifsonia poae TaxID=110933 RepID=A0A9W6HC95_9MICO|nr:hypothetical protein [Leifsonia poae]GLJ77247.1 hypothetical protein GCM10017584_28210 [Leifsonia poae]